MKATALAVAFAVTASLALPAVSAAEDDGEFFLNLGTLHKTERITKAASDRADINFRARYALMEGPDEEADISTSEEAERLLNTLSPDELQLALRILGSDLPAPAPAE